MTDRRWGVRLAAWAWLIGGIVYFLSEALAAVRYPDYSYARDYISALGVPDDSPSATLMNLGAFIVHGILFAAGGVLLVHAIGRTSRGRTAFVVLAVVNGVGNVLVGVFHSGAGPLHGFGALLAIVGGNAAMIVAGGVLADIGAPRWYCVASRIAGVLGLASFVALLAISGADTGLEGAVERAAVYSIIGWDIVTGLMMLLLRPGRQAAQPPPQGQTCTME